jgi:hypothetical protein
MGCAAWRERQAEATPAAPKCLAFDFLNVHWQMADVVTARDNFLECRKLLTASDPVGLGALHTWFLLFSNRNVEARVLYKFGLQPLRQS